MGVDVTAETIIDRPRPAVADYATNPDNDPIWIGGIKESETLTDPPLGEGTRVRRVASFLGKRIEYVNEVEEYVPETRLKMRSVESPIPMMVTYEFEDAGEATRARIHVEGEAGGFYKLAGRALGRAVKRSISGDLSTLKRLLETG